MNKHGFYSLAAASMLVFWGAGCGRSGAPGPSATNAAHNARAATNAFPAVVMVEDRPHADDELVLTVNANRLQWKELKFGVSIHFARARARLGPLGPQQLSAFRNDLYQKVLHGYVYQYLLLDEAKRLGLTLTDEEKKEAAAMAPKMAQATGLSAKILTESLPEPGFFARQAEQAMLVAKVEKKLVADALAISEDDLTRQLDALRAQAEARRKTAEKKKNKIEEIRRQLKSGADFAELAKAHSECPSAPKGGVLGVFTREEIQDIPLRTAAFALKTGEISDVLKTRDGYLILKALNATPATRDGDDKILTPASVELAQIILMTEEPEPIPTRDELLARLRASGLKQGKLELLKKLKAAAKIACPLFPELDLQQ